MPLPRPGATTATSPSRKCQHPLHRLPSPGHHQEILAPSLITSKRESSRVTSTWIEALPNSHTKLQTSSIVQRRHDTYQNLRTQPHFGAHISPDCWSVTREACTWFATSYENGFQNTHTQESASTTCGNVPVKGHPRQIHTVRSIVAHSFPCLVFPIHNLCHVWEKGGDNTKTGRPRPRISQRFGMRHTVRSGVGGCYHDGKGL